jgi:hypothetical protein
MRCLHPGSAGTPSHARRLWRACSVVSFSSLGVWRWWAGTCASVTIGYAIAIGCTGSDVNAASGDNGGADQGGNGSGNSEGGYLPDVPRTSADRFKDILAWLAGRADDTTQSITFDSSGKVVRSSLDGPKPTSADVGKPAGLPNQITHEESTLEALTNMEGDVGDAVNSISQTVQQDTHGAVPAVSTDAASAVGAAALVVAAFIKWLQQKFSS